MSNNNPAAGAGQLSPTSKATAKYSNRDGSKIITVPKAVATAAQPSSGSANQAAEAVDTKSSRKKQRRREKAGKGSNMPTDAAAGTADAQSSAHPDAPQARSTSRRSHSPADDQASRSNDPDPEPVVQSSRKGKKSKKSKGNSTTAAAGDLASSDYSRSDAALGQAVARNNRAIWDNGTVEERDRIRQFWLNLSEDERRSLVKLERDAVLRKIKEQQRQTCTCAVCGRKRSAIEEELEKLYSAYYKELETYATKGTKRMTKAETGPYSYRPMTKDEAAYRRSLTYGRSVVSDESRQQPGYADDGDDEAEAPDDDQRFNRDASQSFADNFLDFRNNLTVEGDGVLTVADDLMQNDGRRFIEMMEQLAERRMHREQNHSGYAGNTGHLHPLDAEHAHHNHAGSLAYQPSHLQSHQHVDAAEEYDEEDIVGDEYDDEDEEEEDEDEDDGDYSGDDDYDEEEEDSDAEHRRAEEGRRMFQIFAARMFEQRVLKAYKESVSSERAKQLLLELDEEKEKEKLAKELKAQAAQRRKEREREKRKAKADEKRRREEQKQAEQVAQKAEKEKFAQEQKAKQEEKRKQKELRRKAEEEERLKKEAERLRRINEQKEKEELRIREAREAREAKEREKKVREQKEAEEKARREQDARERREQQEREARERKEQQEKEARERKEQQEKAEKAAKEKAAAAAAAVAANALALAKEKSLAESPAARQDSKKSQAPTAGSFAAQKSAPKMPGPHTTIAIPIGPKRPVQPSPVSNPATTPRQTRATPSRFGNSPVGEACAANVTGLNVALAPANNATAKSTNVAAPGTSTGRARISSLPEDSSSMLQHSQSQSTSPLPATPVQANSSAASAHANTRNMGGTPGTAMGAFDFAGARQHVVPGPLSTLHQSVPPAFVGQPGGMSMPNTLVQSLPPPPGLSSHFAPPAPQSQQRKLQRLSVQVGPAAHVQQSHHHHMPQPAMPSQPHQMPGYPPHNNAFRPSLIPGGLNSPVSSVPPGLTLGPPPGLVASPARPFFPPPGFGSAIEPSTTSSQIVGSSTTERSPPPRSRHASTSFDPAPSTPAHGQHGSISRPTPIGRPDSVIGQRGLAHRASVSRRDDAEDDTRQHLGSKALLGDDEPLEQVPPPRISNIAPGPRQSFQAESFLGSGGFPAPVGWSSPANTPHLNNPFGPPGSASPLSTAPLGNMAAPALGSSGLGVSSQQVQGLGSAALGSGSFGGSGLASAFSSSLGSSGLGTSGGWPSSAGTSGFGGPIQPPMGVHSRQVRARRQLCESCRKLRSKLGDVDGFMDLNMVIQDSGVMHGLGALSAEEVEQLLSTEGNRENGGGEFDIKDAAGARRLVRLKETLTSSAAPGAVGAPGMGAFVGYAGMGTTPPGRTAGITPFSEASKTAYSSARS